MFNDSMIDEFARHVEEKGPRPTPKFVKFAHGDKGYGMLDAFYEGE